jgi:hypothetical protein
VKYYVACYGTNNELRVGDVIGIFEVSHQNLNHEYYKILYDNDPSRLSRGYRSFTNFHHIFKLKYLNKSEAETLVEMGVVKRIEDGSRFSFIGIDGIEYFV